MKLEKLLTIINKSTSKEKLIEAFQLALVIILETEKGNQESFKEVNSKYEEIVNRINTDTSIQELRDKLNEEITNLQNSISNIQLLKGDKGDKGDSIKGDKGDNYILTPEDKREIASSIEVPIVEKIIEKTEIIKEQPIVKEVAIYEDRKEIIDKINKGGVEKIDSKQIKGFDDLEKRIDGKHFPVMGGGTPVSISHNGTLKDKEVRNINFTGDVITSVTQNNGTVTVDIDDLSETDPLWTADKPNYLTSSTATSTYVPYTGANADVDLGTNGLFADTIRTTSVFENYNSAGIDFYSDEGITSTGTLLNQIDGNYEFYQGDQGNGGIAGILDFSTITTESKTYTFPDHTGNILVDGADIDLGDNSLTVHGLTVNDGIYALADIDLVGTGSLRFTDADGITMYSEICVGGDNMISLGGNGSVNYALLDLSGLTGDGDRTFTFPDHTGTFLVDGADVDLGAFGLTTNDITISSLTNTYIPYASTAGLLSNSGLYWDNANTRLGIGTTAPDKKLEINSATGDCLRLTYNDSNGSATTYVDLLTTSGGDLTITPSGGDISIGTANLGTTGALKGVHKAADGTGAVADGTYTVGIGGTTNGTITIKDGIITAIQQAVA